MQPINRKVNNNLTEQAEQQFAQCDKRWLAIAPEGTRSRVNKLKSGYYIARQANVPILAVG